MRTILNHRYTRKKQTVLTTNLPLEPAGSHYSETPAKDYVLEERIGVALYSRIMEMCQMIEMRGQDARIELHKASLDARPF